MRGSAEPSHQSPGSMRTCARREPRGPTTVPAVDPGRSLTGRPPVECFAPPRLYLKHSTATFVGRAGIAGGRLVDIITPGGELLEAGLNGEGVVYIAGIANRIVLSIFAKPEIQSLADLRGTGRLDIVAPGKDGLHVFFNEGL